MYYTAQCTALSTSLYCIVYTALKYKLYTILFPAVFIALSTAVHQMLQQCRAGCRLEYAAPAPLAKQEQGPGGLMM